MGRFVDITGRRFGRLIVVQRLMKPDEVRTLWLCRCDCGGTTETRTWLLNSGHTQSCGCLQRERISAAAKISSRTHGKSKTHPLYGLWGSLKSRCRNPNATGYKRYGGRGIKMCERWNDFDLFIKDVGTRPSPDHTLDRKDPNGNYEPGNVRWATAEEQVNNLANPPMVIYRGERMPVFDAWAMSGKLVSRDTLGQRLRKGWTVERALETPPLTHETLTAKLYSCNGQTRTLRQWSRATGIPVKTLHGRIFSRWPIDLALTTPSVRGNRLKSIQRRKS